MSVTTNNAAGGIAGNIYNGNTLQALVKDCTNTGAVTSVKMAGGIVGQLCGTLSGGSNSGTIQGDSSFDNNGSILNCQGELIGYTTGAAIENISELAPLKNVFETQGGMPVSIKLTGSITVSDDITSANARFLDFSGNTTFTVADGKTFTNWTGYNNTIRGEEDATLTIAGAGSFVCTNTPYHFYGTDGQVINGTVPTGTYTFAKRTDGTFDNRNDEIWAAPVTVGTADTLRTALNSYAGTIKLADSITVSAPIVIARSVTIDGQGHTLTGNTTGGNKRQGVFHIFNEEDRPVAFTLNNTNIVNQAGTGGNKWTDACGISVRASNQTVNLSNVSIDTSHYCIFVGVPGNEEDAINNVELNISGSQLTGYSAIYYRTNSTTNTINDAVLNVYDSTLIGRGVSGYGNGFATIVFNGTRNANAAITGCTLSNSFNATNVDASEGVIQFNCYYAYEKGATVTLADSTIQTKSTTAAPNVVKYTCMENLGAEANNRVIIDNLTITVDGNEADLIRVMRNGNELVATGVDLKTILSLKEYQDGYPEGYPNSYKFVVESGDIVSIPTDTTVAEDTTIPEGITVAVTDGAVLNGSANVHLIVNGTVTGVSGITGTGTYEWSDGSWVLSTPDP